VAWSDVGLGGKTNYDLCVQLVMDGSKGWPGLVMATPNEGLATSFGFLSNLIISMIYSCAPPPDVI